MPFSQLLRSFQKLHKYATTWVHQKRGGGGGTRMQANGQTLTSSVPNKTDLKRQVLFHKNFDTIASHYRRKSKQLRSNVRKTKPGWKQFIHTE